MKVLVCGGRDYEEWDALWACLDDLLAKHPDMIVIQGGQRRWLKDRKRWIGADKAAEEWAQDREVPCLRIPAKWKSMPRHVAGFERNKRQLSTIGLPDLCVHAPGGAGTADMVAKCAEAGVPRHPVTA